MVSEFQSEGSKSVPGAKTFGHLSVLQEAAWLSVFGKLQSIVRFQRIEY
jgi:hypothetical protein